jgi:hypothetical protein
MNDTDDIDALAQSQEHAAAIRAATEHLHRLFAAYDLPSIPETIALTATKPTERSEASAAAKSITIFNPSPSIVYMGYAGGRASAEARAWSIPPGSMLTLPVRGEDLEFGAEADQLADGDVVFFMLRHQQVFPPFFGTI